MAILKVDLRQRIFNYTHHLRGLKNGVNGFYFINQNYPERYQAEYREVLDKAKKIKRKNKQLIDNQKVKVAIKNRTLCVNEIPQSLADLGGCAGCTSPLWDQILSFSHTFFPKSTHVGGPRPPNGSIPPHGKSCICHCQ